MTLMVITVSSSGLRGLQSTDIETIIPPVPSFKISGVAQILQALNSVSNTTFDVITLDSFTQNNTEQGVVYEGKLRILSDQGVNITGTVNGVWDQATNNLHLTASSYLVDTEQNEVEAPEEEGENPTTPTEDGYNPIDIEQAKNDPQVSAAFDWAVEELIATGERQNKIPVSQYTVTEWSSAASKNTPRGVNYKFVAKLLGANYVHIETSMTVFYRSENQTYKLAGYYYKATNITKGSLPNNFTDVDNNNNTNNTDTTPIVPVGYTYISSEDLAINTQAQEALNWGVNALIQTAISQYKLPAASDQYNITNLISAAYKNQSFGVTYLFKTKLTNALNYKVDANITVSYRTALQGFLLPAYSFRSYNYPANAIVIPPPQNNDTNTTIPDNSTVIPPTNDTQPVDNSTVVNPPANDTQPVDNSTNTPTPVNPAVPNGFTLITPEQLATDSLVQDALKYGVDNLIQKAISQKKIPASNPNYTVNNLVLAVYKKQVIGTTYKFIVNTTNVDYVHVDATINVLYRYATKTFSLNGYSFKSYNYSKSDLVQNNTNTPVPPVVNTPEPVDNNTVVDPNNNSPVVVDDNAPVNNSTNTEEVPVAPIDNSTVVDPSTVPTVEDNTPVAESEGDNVGPVVEDVVPVVEDDTTVLVSENDNVGTVVDNAATGSV